MARLGLERLDPALRLDIRRSDNVVAAGAHRLQLLTGDVDPFASGIIANSSIPVVQLTSSRPQHRYSLP